MTQMIHFFFLLTSRKVLSTFGTFCPIRVQIAQTIVHFAYFQVQARMAVHLMVTVPKHTVKFLYTYLSLGPQGSNPLLCHSASTI